MTMPPDHKDVLAAYLISAPNTGTFRMCRVERGLVERMREQLPAQTPPCVMATFGISMNSWVKLRDDLPVRRSLAERLVQRLLRAGFAQNSLSHEKALAD
ncbi:MAG: hypothetical protein JHD35_02005 [Sphingopyxis sp.]|nr:hypothetical protein [Sphingopyxis sp.]